MPLVPLILLFASAAFSGAAQPAAPKKETTAADPFMGDWQGVFKQQNGPTTPLVAQVIALGDGRYHANFLPEFDKRVERIASLEGRVEGGAVRFFGWGDVSAYRGPDWQGVIANGTFTGKVPSRHGGTFHLEKVVRLSPTLGAKPPAGAVVLFDGTSFDSWASSQKGGGAVKWDLADGAMIVKPGTPSITTKGTFTYFKLHLEFRTPFKPKAREQERGNSGVSLHRREVQVLDNYGLEGRDKECGGLYNRVAPLVNMCAPPLQWQTYDITVPPPGKDGKARLTVLHNGVKILDGHELGGNLRPTTIRLQEHGNRIGYRNIWLVELPVTAH